MKKTKNISFELAASNSMLDVIIYHHPMTYFSNITKPSIHHVHDMLFFEHGHLYHPVIGSASLKKEIELCFESLKQIPPESKIIYTSEYVKNNHIRPKRAELLNNQSFIIRNCVLDNLIQTIERNPINDKIIFDKLFAHMPYVTYPTQPRPTKQFHLLHKVIERLRQSIPDLTLILTCAPESYRKFYSDIVPDYVYFMPHLSRSDLFALYSNAFMTIVTTVYEASLSWQFLESLSAGTPAICFKSSIIDEFIKNGYIDEMISSKYFFDDIDQAEEAVLENWTLYKDNTTKYSSIANKILNSLSSTLPVTSWTELSKQYLNVIDKTALSK